MGTPPSARGPTHLPGDPPCLPGPGAVVSPWARRGGTLLREVQPPLSPRASSSPPVPPQVPLPEEIQVVPGDTEIHRVEPEEIANHLTAFHWELFRCIHEVGGWLRGWGGRCCAVAGGP